MASQCSLHDAKIAVSQIHDSFTFEESIPLLHTWRNLGDLVCCGKMFVYGDAFCMSFVSIFTFSHPPNEMFRVPCLIFISKPSQIGIQCSGTRNCSQTCEINNFCQGCFSAISPLKFLPNQVLGNWWNFMFLAFNVRYTDGATRQLEKF